MKTLIVIYGEVRTIEHCLMSIFDNLIVPNKPCDIILAIDGSYKDIPQTVVQLLNVYLIDIYVTQNKEYIERDYNRIEFSLVAEVLKRVNDIEQYTFILKVRTDLFIKQPIQLKTIYGLCSLQHFQHHFLSFVKKLPFLWQKNPFETIRAWFLTAGLHFFISKQLDNSNPPNSPWCTKNIFEWNNDFFKHIEFIISKYTLEKMDNVSFYYHIIRQLSKDKNIVYLIGSTWIHFGFAEDILFLSLNIQKEYTTLKWDNTNDDNEMEWIDHKNVKHVKKISELKLITDNQFRMIHHIKHYPLMDLVNNDDYIESFDAPHSHLINKKSPTLFAWIVRSHHFKEKN